VQYISNKVFKIVVTFYMLHDFSNFQKYYQVGKRYSISFHWEASGVNGRFEMEIGTCACILSCLLKNADYLWNVYGTSTKCPTI